jgi:hypothetical protein
VILAQEQTDGFVLQGILLTAETSRPAALCNIFNESKRTANISDTNGNFSIPVSIGDTLIFTALGYYGKTFTVLSIHRNVKVSIYLNIRSYEIDELRFSMPRTYSGFKKAFLEVEPEKDIPMAELPRYNPYIRPKLLDTNHIYSRSFKIFHPISGFYYKNNKEEQSKRKVRYLQEQQLHQDEVDAKYNNEIIQRITGFTGDTLMNFNLYCSFGFNYLYMSTELEIVEEIERKKQLFILHCYGQCIPVTISKKRKKGHK